MLSAADLRRSLQSRGIEVPAELESGQSLSEVLCKHLMAIEAVDSDLITSILLLSHDGKRLSHGAAPRLPHSYRDAIDGSEIGPVAGSCGTAAYFGRPIYVSDIATDPLWENYRDIALPHGLKSCWSTPIRDPHGKVLGTFAIYRPSVGDPTPKEVEAIAMIAEHVAQAIVFARHVQDLEPPEPAKGGVPRLQLVSEDHDCTAVYRHARLLALADRLQAIVGELDKLLGRVEAQETVAALKEAAELSELLSEAIRLQVKIELEFGGLQ